MKEGTSPETSTYGEPEYSGMSEMPSAPAASDGADSTTASATSCPEDWVGAEPLTVASAPPHPAREANKENRRRVFVSPHSLIGMWRIFFLSGRGSRSSELGGVGALHMDVHPPTASLDRDDICDVDCGEGTSTRDGAREGGVPWDAVQ